MYSGLLAHRESRGLKSKAKVYGISALVVVLSISGPLLKQDVCIPIKLAETASKPGGKYS